MCLENCLNQWKFQRGLSTLLRNRCDNMNEAERPRSVFQTDSKNFKGWRQLDTDAQPYFCWKEDYIFDCHLSSAARGCFTSKQKLLVFVCVCVFQVATQNISKLGAANVHLIYQFMASRKCWSMSRWFANPLFSKPRCRGVGETWRLQANSPGIGLDLEQNLTPGAPFLASKMTGCPKVWVAWLRPLYNREINKVCAWERLEIYMEI